LSRNVTVCLCKYLEGGAWAGA